VEKKGLTILNVTLRKCKTEVTSSIPHVILAPLSPYKARLEIRLFISNYHTHGIHKARRIFSRCVSCLARSAMLMVDRKIAIPQAQSNPLASNS
jgi:hypothetical protein